MSPSDDKKPKKELPLRAKVGWIAVGMAALVAFGVYQYYKTGDVGLFELNRMLVIMILLWLAWPELEALPRWLLYFIPISAVVCAWRPQLLIVVLPLAFFYLLLRPSKRRGRKSKKTKSTK